MLGLRPRRLADPWGNRYEDLVRRLASGVAPGGTLLLVGHHSEATAQVQVSLAAAARAVLEQEQEPGRWTLSIAEDRPAAMGTGTDAVICAQRTVIA